MPFAYILVIFILIMIPGVSLCVRAYRKGEGAYRTLYIALFFLSLCSAFLFKQGVDFPAVSAFIPFYKVIGLREYGYASVLRDLVSYAVPFVFAGFLLIPAFPRAGLLTAFTVGAVSALLFNVYPLFQEAAFITDEYIFAGLGSACGAAMYSIVSNLVKKKLPLNEIHLPVPLHRHYSGSMVLIIAVYLGIALVMVFDYGQTYAPIQFFESETPLPDELTLECDLSDDNMKANIYIPSNTAPGEKASSLAGELGINGSVTYDGGTYTVEDANARLTLTDSGSWVYELVSSVSGDIPTKESACEAVYEFFSSHALLEVGLNEVTDIVDRLDVLGAVEGYDIYFSTAVNSMPIVGSSTLVVSVRAGSAITKIRRYDGDVLPSTIVNIISQHKAYELVAEGKCAYTLFSPASSARITGCSIVYIANSSQGYYLPVWMFSCTAILEDGSEAPFEIYVEAMK